MDTPTSPSQPAADSAANPVLPTYSLEGDDIRCQEPRMITVRVSGLSEADFLAAYRWAWASLAHFDPAALSAMTGGVISPERATQAKTMFAAELVAYCLEPRRGQVVSAHDLRMQLLESAFYFMEDALSAQDHAGIARGLALILGTDEARAGRLADGRRQMMER